MSKSWWFCLYFILSAGGVFFSFVLKLPSGGLLAGAGFGALFVVLYLYLKPVTEAVGFLMELFQLPGRGGKNPYLFHLAHHRNRYLRKIWPGLSFYLSSAKTPVPSPQRREAPDFQDIVDRVVERGRRFFPSLQIRGEVLSRMKVEVFSESLFQCLWELVKNAARARASSLVLRGFKNKEWFCIEVKDTGCGMSPGVLKQARDLYFSTTEGASGMGLNVVDQVLSRMGGVMQIQSSGEDQGVSVTLFIPQDYMDYAKNLGFHSLDPRLPGGDEASHRGDEASGGGDEVSGRNDETHKASSFQETKSFPRKRESTSHFKVNTALLAHRKRGDGEVAHRNDETHKASSFQETKSFPKSKSFPRKRESTSHFKVNAALLAHRKRGDGEVAHGGGPLG